MGHGTRKAVSRRRSIRDLFCFPRAHRGLISATVRRRQLGAVEARLGHNVVRVADEGGFRGASESTEEGSRSVRGGVGGVRAGVGRGGLTRPRLGRRVTAGVGRAIGRREHLAGFGRAIAIAPRAARTPIANPFPPARPPTSAPHPPATFRPRTMPPRAVPPWGAGSAPATGAPASPPVAPSLVASAPNTGTSAGTAPRTA
jgi:hypothetical protein